MGYEVDILATFELFEQAKKLNSYVETMSLCGMIIDYTSVKFGIDRKKLLEMLTVVNDQVNEECGKMEI